MKKFSLFSMLLLFMTAGSVSAQEAYTKWKQVQDPATLESNDEVVVVDLTTSSAMKNNPAYEGESTVSKESPAAMKLTLKEELDRITSEFGDTVIWTVDRTDGKYQLWFKNKEDNTRYLLNSDQNLRVGFVSKNDAWKRTFDLDKGLLFMGEIETEQDVYKDFHVGLKAASGFMAMMGGNKWEMAADAENGEINADIAATKMAFFKKVVTTLPDPTLRFAKHDYEADLQQPGAFVSPVAEVEDGAGTITYYSGNTNLAEVDENTGAVTIKKRGTVRIYAQVSATDSYDDYLTSYILRIDDSDAAGGRNNPFTVAQAVAYAKEGGHEEEAADGVCYFVKGIVSSVGGAMAGMADMMDMFSGMMEGMEGMEGFDMSAMMGMFMGEQEEGTVTYAISDNGVNRDSLSIINGRGMQLVDITTDSVSVGDKVTVFGPLEYSEDNDMMAMFSGMGNQGNNEQEQEKKMSVKMPSVNYMQEQMRNLTTEDIILYYGQTKSPEELYSIKDLFGGTQIMNETTLVPSDNEVACWVVNDEKTDSVLTPKKTGIITITVKAPVMLNEQDTIKMQRRFTVDVRDRDLLAAGTMVGDYQLVKSTDELKAGDKLIVVSTIGDKNKILVKGSNSGGSNPMMSMMGGGSNNAKDVTINDDGKITEIPDETQILTLEQADGKWLLQTGKTPDGVMTYLYISEPADGGSNSMIPGMGSAGATLKTGVLEGEGAAGDSCQVTFTFLPEQNDSVKIQFNFADREKDGNVVTAKNVIRCEKSTMSTAFGGYEPDNAKATLPRLYRLVQADQYDVNITSALWATLVSAYDVTLPEKLKGYIVTTVEDSKVVLDEVASIEQGKPYILKGETAGTYTLTRATEKVTMPEGNLLQISDNTTGNGVYVLANVDDVPGLYIWNGGALGAGRVFLQKSSTTARSFLEFCFGETTGISHMATSTWSKGNVYNLNGQRVVKPSKGLYIDNGRKVVIK